MPVVIAEETLRAARLSPASSNRKSRCCCSSRPTHPQPGQPSGRNAPAALQHLLASREIPLHYDIADFEADLATLDTLHPA